MSYPNALSSPPRCTVPDCESLQVKRSWCNRHYKKWLRNGHPEAGRWDRLPTFEERLWQKVIKTESCWLWEAAASADGRGKIRRDGRLVQAYRAVYELLVGPIPDGLQIDHLCRTPACVNPAHLEAVTGAENTRRADSNAPRRAMTHCKRGHAFTSENTRITSQGSRLCRACKKEREAA